LECAHIDNQELPSIWHLFYLEIRMNQAQTCLDHNDPDFRTVDITSPQKSQRTGARQSNWTFPEYRLNPSRLPLLLQKDTPVLDVLTPFSQHEQLTVNKSVPVERAEQIMMDLGISLLTVVDSDGHALGILESSDVLGEKPIRLAHDRHVHHDEITAEDIMVPFADMHAMSLERVSKMSVASILSELNTIGKAFALIVDNLDKAERRVEGVLSAGGLIRRLDPTATWLPANRSFADIEAAIGP
jgi:hypothetical protein